MYTVSLQTKLSPQFIDITDDVDAFVKISEIDKGNAVVFSPHTTTAIIINENDSKLLQDFVDVLEHLVPKKQNYNHNTSEYEGNGHSHCRQILLGSSETVLIEDGKLCLGAWQRIFFVELDSPRDRKIIIQIMGNKNL